MKWLDKKGRIGGVINVFDLLVLAVAVFLIQYYWFQAPALVPSSAPDKPAPAPRAEAKPREEPKRSPAVLEDIQFVFRDLDPAVAARVRAGDKDSTHPDTTAEIVEVLGNERAANIISLGSRKVLAYPPGEKRQVRVRMKIRGLTGDKTFFYKGQSLIRGRSYTFVTPKYVLVGEALRVDDTFIGTFMPVKRWVRIWAQAEAVHHYLAEMVREGDRALPPKDGAANVLRLEIKRILRNDPKRIQKRNARGEVRDELNPKWRDMELILECLCAHDRRGYHYGSQAARAGDDANFKTELYSLPLKFQKVEVLPMDYHPAAGS